MSPTGSTRVEALGTIFDLAVDDDVLSRTLARLLSDVQVDDAATAPPVVRVTGQGPWHATSPAVEQVATDFSAALSLCMTALNLSAIAGTMTLAFHCAVLARDGAALVMPAASGTGKTTLCAALLQRGWDYVSDEALCLGFDDLAVRAYARPLALSTWSADVLGVVGTPGSDEVFIMPADLGAKIARDTIGMAHLVMLERDGTTPRLDPVSRADGAAALMRNSFTQHLNAPAALAQVARLLSCATTHRLHLGDPHQAADLLTSSL